MRVGTSSTSAIGVAIALLLAVAPMARGQQQEPRRTTTSTRRIPISKDRPPIEAPAPAPVATRVNRDSIAAADRARQEERFRQEERLRQEERARQDERARRDQMRSDSIANAERQRQDSIAAADAARQDSIARANEKAQSNAGLRMSRSRNAGFYIGLAGGSTMPIGDLKDDPTSSYDMGWNVTLPFGWDFGSFPLGLRFDLAMDNLKAKTSLVDPFGNPMRNVVIYSGSGGLKLNIPIFRTASRFYLMGGGGAHRITGYAKSVDSVQTVKDAKTNIGWYGGAGVNLRLGRSAIFIESRYINVDPKQPVGFAYPKANYIPIIAGFQF
jgi:hypothetical protein